MKNIKDPPYRAEGDGIKDDTDAIAYAMSELREGERLEAPFGVYRIKGDGPSIFTHNAPLTIAGEGWGTRFLIDSNVPMDRDIFHFTPTGYMQQGWAFRDFQVSSEAPGAGRHVLRFEGTDEGCAAFVAIERLRILQTNGFSIKTINNNVGAGQLAYSHIADCNLESLDLRGIGDGLLVDGNTISGEDNPAVWVRQVIGAGGFNLLNNVITAKHNLAVYLEHGVSANICYNEFETPIGKENKSTAVIWIGNPWDDVAWVRGLQLIGNGVSVLAGCGDPVPIRMAKASNALISGGRLFVDNPLSAHIQLDKAATGTVIQKDTIDCNPPPLRIIQG